MLACPALRVVIPKPTDAVPWDMPHPTRRRARDKREHVTRACTWARTRAQAGGLAAFFLAAALFPGEPVCYDRRVFNGGNPRP